jgi:hypothetical protein
VRVPDNAASGTVKITLSFPNWKARSVLPSAAQFPLELPNGAPTGQ